MSAGATTTCGAAIAVFRFQGKAKQMIVAEIFAARFGSALDSVLTLYDEHGHIVGQLDRLGLLGGRGSEFAT